MNANSKRKANQAVQRLIRDAFAGVTLEDGIGLLEGLEIDSYADHSVRMAARCTDEKSDWANVPIDDLNGAATSLGYFDAKGMRFYLPAFLIADLQGLMHQEVVFWLCSNRLDHRFSLFNRQQRHAVLRFLQHHLDSASEVKLGFEGNMVQAAVDGYWSQKGDADTE